MVYFGSRWRTASDCTNLLRSFAKQKKQEEVSEQVESRDIVREGLYEQH